MTVLITGGTGSLGQSLAKELLKTGSIIRIFSRDEYLQWLMRLEFGDDRLRYLIGDVRDKDRLKRAMKDVDVVIHTAALKHVSTAEYNPIEAIKTNVDGAINVIDASLDCGVKKCVFISSDKAVYPINLYGATKLVGEKLFIQANVYGETKFSCVRFGNFSPSRGNVEELWNMQKDSGEITITDTEMTRYWIKIEDAAKFVLDSIEKMEGGETFIPNMRVRTLASVAHEIAPDAKRNVISRQRGEKMHELLRVLE